uniref:eCIS core domain-containing protein n=1 Tax=Kofleria flava TaxID=694315 RepID=A0A3S5GXN0_9BACT|nr:hypothetical protein [Kofleria flava]
MDKDDRQNGSAEQLGGSRESQPVTRPAPGKVTRTSKLSPGGGGLIQRKAAAGGAAAPQGPSLWDHTMAPAMDAAHRGLSALAERGPDGPIQRKASGDPVDQATSILSGRGAEAGPSTDTSSLASLPRGGGAPLDGSIASRVEKSTGATLGDVRVHTGAASVQAAADLGARAFTTGSDIHVGKGESASDVQLMAHEAAHTIQQAGRSGGAQAKAEVSQPGDALEREADAVAAAVTSGGTAPVSAGAAPAIQRDVVSEVEERLSYGALDWAVTDEDAVEALNLLAGLGQPALEAAMTRLGGDYKSRLLDNLPESARQTSAYTRVLVAMGPAAVQPYVQSLLSYGVFDWAITDADAQSVFRILMALQGPQRAQLWTGLGAGFRTRLVENLQRAAAVGPDEQGGLKALFDATPDAEVDALCALMKLRFRITFQATEDTDETPMAWEAGGLRRLWTVLEALPPTHVEGNSAFEFMERYAHESGDSAGGYYASGRENAAMSYDPATLGDPNQAARQNVLRDDGTRVDDPLYGVNRFDKVVRHEVGHAVDEENGHSDTYCVGNEGGGDWAKLDKGGVAEALVTASGGDISSWSDATQKAAIIACLQGVVDARKPGELDARIDALAGLSAEDKTKVKGDSAVQVLKGCFALSGHNPWYKYPDTGGVVLSDRIYQEAYPGDWWSYKQSTRSRKVSTYQYRAPGEWFAEAYAAYYTPSANKGDLLARVDAATKAWFDSNVDPDGGRPNGSGPPPTVGDFPTTTGGDGTALA